MAAYFHFAGTSYSATDQANTRGVAATLKRLGNGLSAGTLFGTDSQAESNDTRTDPAGNDQLRPGQLFEDIQSLVLVEENNVDGYDPLWIVKARRKDTV